MEQKKIALQWFRLISEHKIEELCELTASTWIMHGGPLGLPPGPAGVREFFRTMAPIDEQWRIEDLIAEEDKVVVRASNTSIQKSFFDIPGNGSRQVFTVMFIHRIAGGKIMETWRNTDDLGRLIQLGVLIEGFRQPDTGNAFGPNIHGLWMPWIKARLGND
jgi:hypothetical protein